MDIDFDRPFEIIDPSGSDCRENVGLNTLNEFAFFRWDEARQCHVFEASFTVKEILQPTDNRAAQYDNWPVLPLRFARIEYRDS